MAGANKVPNIDLIDNIITMAQTMSTLGISAEGLTTLSEMKNKVKEEVKLSQANADWDAGKAYSVLSEARNEDARKRARLLELYAFTLECLEKKADERLIRLLDSNFSADIKQEVRKHRNYLTIKEYVVLVAGETSSGKSTLINLILGEELLPSHLLCTTATISELRYGKERKIVVYYKKVDPETNKEKEEFELSETESGKSYMAQISPFMNMKDDRERGSPFHKVVLYWPHELLEKGVVIVDSPGIGESESMDELVMNYLAKAFCFLYIMNSTNAGGIHKDRIEKLFAGAQKYCEDREESLLCESALFVCNKWDGVPKDEQSEVKEHIIKKLKKCWPKMTPESQIIYLSATAATISQRHGMISDDFRVLINSVKYMVLRAIDARLQTYTSWLDYVVSRIIYHTKAFIHNAAKDRQEVIERLRVVSSRVEDIETNHRNIMQELQERLRVTTDELVRKLFQHVSSRSFRDSFTSWTNDDAPKKQETWLATVCRIQAEIKSRLREEIEIWEEKYSFFSNSRESLMKEMNEKLNFLECQISNVEQCISDGLPLRSLEPPKDKLFTTYQKILLGLTSPIWIPIGLAAVVLALPVIGLIVVKEQQDEKQRIRNYVKNKGDYMAEKSKDFLNSVTANENYLREIVKENLQDVVRYLNAAKKNIPGIIEANKILLLEFLAEAIDKKEMADYYLPVYSKMETLRGDLAMFMYIEIHPTDISANDLVWIERADNRLGSGAFSSVYRGEIKKKQTKLSVALKVFNDALETKNAYQFLIEETILRNLSHPNIVKFHGTALLKAENACRLIFVMELCTANLRNYLAQHPETVPGERLVKSELSTVMKAMVQRALEITYALSYIHGRGIVHRDLKTENILVLETKSTVSLKISDVGISKKVEDVTGTFIGTPIYIAPEVFSSSVYDSKADMYSFALILWELWFGKIAYSEQMPFNWAAFSQNVRAGYRPPYPECSMPPPPDIEELIQSCWATSPNDRPGATEVRDSLLNMLKLFGV